MAPASVDWWATRRAPVSSGEDGGSWRARGFDQYHEPPDELPSEIRTFARLCASLTEEAEAIGWYEQRLAIEPDPRRARRDARRGRRGVQALHAWTSSSCCASKPEWREIAQGVLFQEGDIVEHGEAAEAAAGEATHRDPQRAVRSATQRQAIRPRADRSA